MRQVCTEVLDDEMGYTLIELLVTLSIMAVLFAIITPQVVGYLSRAKQDSARVQLRNIEAALDLYYLDMGAYPTTEEGLKVLWSAPEDQSTKWQGPYIRVRSELADPWGNAFVYSQPGEHEKYDLVSLGADNAQGGEGDAADISNYAP